MNLTDEFKPIRDWAQERGILDKGNVKTQTLKLVEEVGELAKAAIEDRQADFEDAIGDCVVVLTSLAHLAGTNIESCINLAFAQIRDRKGKMENGTFIKES